MNNQTTNILTIETIELYQRFYRNSCLISSGPLSIVYYLSNNSFALQAKNFSYTLTRDMIVIAAPPKHGDLYPCYVIPNRESELIIKIIRISSPETLSSFETLLNNNCSLSYKDQPEEIILGPLKEASGEEEENKASKIITKIGEFTRTGLINSAWFISRGIMRFGGFIQSKCTKEIEETKIDESTTEKLDKADSATEKASSFAQNLIKGACSLIGRIFSKEAGQKIMNSNFAAKIKEKEYYESARQLGKSSVYASACVYDGATEALSMIGREIRDTTAKVMSSKYGEQMGNATRKGFSVLGNIGRIIGVFKEEATKVIQSSKKHR